MRRAGKYERFKPTIIKLWNTKDIEKILKAISEK